MKNCKLNEYLIERGNDFIGTETVGVTNAKI